MKAVDWPELIRRHPLFASLNETEITSLLTEAASQERTYSQDGLIVRAGEVGDSLFLIGVGSVQITAWGISVATLGKGEIFGEMAVLEGKPRAASVTAREASTLLEIKGDAFRELLKRHPEMRAKIGVKMKQRVEQSQQQ